MTGLSRRERGRSFHVVAALLILGAAAFPLAGAEKPSLIVVLSVDQMREDYLERFHSYFGKDGFNRFLERGAVFPQTRHRHAVTFTGPGYASIGTGLDPRDNGIIGNLWYDRVEGREVYCSEDRGARFVGEGRGAPGKIPTSPASPVLLDGASLGDRVKENFPQSRVVGIALKDRAAVLMAGRKADAALWFEERFERFVTSSYYPPHASLLSFNEQLPAFFAEPGHRSWKLSGRIPEVDLSRITFDPPELYGAKYPPEGYGATFPHTLSNVRAILSSPWGDELMLRFARFVIQDLHLGAGDQPDLLFVGLSSTDYYGHAFGPDSKEIADGMVRLDGALESFFRWLDEKVGRDRVLLFLTADHGVTPLPEVTRARERQRTGKDDPLVAGRVNFSDGPGPAATVAQVSPDRVALEEHLARQFGYPLDTAALNAREGAILLFEEPSLYLNRAVLARRGCDAERVKEAVRDWVKSRPGVLLAYTNTQILDGLPATAPFSLAIERSFRADRSGDIFAVLKPGWMWSFGKEAGTTHGQPYDDDARVPLLVWGAGVRAGSSDAKVSPLSIARTVGALFGFEVGEPDAEVLEPVLGREMGTKQLEARP